MGKREQLIREIEEEANVRAGDNPDTHYVLSAKAAIAVIEDLDSAVLQDDE